jgi:hypothetical protein
MKHWILLCLLLVGCVGKTFSDTKEFEQYPLRQADEKETTQLKACAKAIYTEQKAHFQQEKKYFQKVTELHIDEACSGIFVRLYGNQKNYRTVLMLHKNDTTVKWNVDAKGRISEEADEDISDDLSF